jgi:hypothetical protein
LNWKVKAFLAVSATVIISTLEYTIPWFVQYF